MYIIQVAYISDIKLGLYINNISIWLEGGSGVAKSSFSYHGDYINAPGSGRLPELY